MTVYHTGYRYRQERRRVKSLGERFPSLTSLPTRVDLNTFAPSVFDQGYTSSCVGHARSAGLYTTLAAQGRPLPFVPSPADLYRVARLIERPHGPIKDDGCDPIDSLDGARLYGIRPMIPLPERYSDADPANINALPTLDDFLQDSLNQLPDDYAVYSDKVHMVCLALASGCTVCVDVPGGHESWQNYTSGTLGAPSAGADHYVLLTGYDMASVPVNGYTTTFIGRNSWGSGWGLRGCFMCDESVVLAANDIITNVGRHG